MSNAKLPHVKSSIPQDLRVFIDRLRDIMGATGANQLVTYNDLVSARLATLNNSGALTPVGTDTYLATPPTPTGLSASAAIRNIVLSWDNPAYVGHSHAEVWAADSNDLATAVLIGQSPGALYIDNVGPSTTKYYWVRFVNREGTAGAYNSQTGTSATTGDDTAYTLGLLAGEITKTELSSSLNSRIDLIDLIDGPSTTIGTIPYYLAQVQGQIDAINSYPDYDGATTYAANDIVKYDGGLYKATATTTGNLPTDTNYWVKIGDYTSIADAVVTIASDLSQVITELGVEVSDREALALQLRGSYTGTDVGSLTTGLLYNEKTLREYEDGLLATEISSVSATANGKNTIYRQTTAPTSPAVNDIWIDTKISYSETYFDEEYAVPKYKQYQWNGAEWIDITDTEVYDNHAYFISEQTARISADEAIATNITQLESQINGELAVTNARITTEEETRATETGALATRTTTLESSLFDEATGLAATRADIQTNYSTKVDTDSAIASTKTVLRAYADLGSRTFKTDTAPTIRGYDTDTDPATEVPLQEGDIWIDTSVDAELGVVLNKIYVWDGAEWVYTPDGVAAADTASLESTLTTNYYTKTDVDGTIATKETFLRSYANISSKTFYSGSAPTIRGTDPETSDDIPLQTGDVWIKTTDNTRYVWNDDAWQAVSDTKAFDDWVTNTYSPFVSDTNAAIDGKVEFWFDTSDPSTAWTDDTERGKHVGDLWYDDTADAKALKRYTYDAGHDPVYYWVDVVDQTAINAADAAAEAQSTADGKITAFYQDNEPTAEGTGDLWFDTNDGNKPYRWTGSEWASTQDGAIGVVDARVTNVENTKIGYATLDATGEVFDNDGTITNKTEMDVWNADNPTNLATWNVGLPLASVVKQVAISDGTQSIALEQRFTAQKNINDTLAASYTLKIDDNGSVAGIGLFSEDGQSEFLASVDRFGVEAPLSSIDLWQASTFYQVGDIVRKASNDSVTYVCKVAGTSGTTVPVSAVIGTRVEDNEVLWQVASRVPFAVQATPSSINGVDVPAGVYIDAAYIVNGTINNAQIADASIDVSKIAELTVGDLRAGTMQVDSYIKSTSYDSGSGFFIGADGQILSVSGGNKARMWSGNFEIYKTVPSVGEVLYKALSRAESGVGANNVEVTIPGYFISQPKVIVSPASIQLYNQAYSNQSQSLNVQAVDIHETSEGSMVWRFTPVATLTLAANTGLTIVNQNSGVISSNWSSSQYTTPANTTRITPSVYLASNRGNGASQYYYRTVRWRVVYYNGSSWIAGGWTTSNLGADTAANVTTTADFTFPSSGTWTFYIEAEAYDTNGSLFGSIVYDYNTSTVSVAGPASNTWSSRGTYTLDLALPSNPAPSGYTVYEVNYSVGWSFSRQFYYTAIVSIGGQFVVYNTTNSTASGTRSFTTSSYSTTALRATTTVNQTSLSDPDFGSVTVSLSNGSAVVKSRKAQTNSTTAQNVFQLNSYAYELSTAQVLATGSLNWVAIGD